MWLIPAPYRVLALAVAAALVFGAVYWKGHHDGTVAGDRKLLKMYESAQAVLKKRDENIARNLEVYREELAALHDRPVKRVLYCPAARLPATPGGTAGAGAGPADPVDLGPLLREALDELVRCNTLRSVL